MLVGSWCASVSAAAHGRTSGSGYRINMSQGINQILTLWAGVVRFQPLSVSVSTAFGCPSTHSSLYCEPSTDAWFGQQQRVRKGPPCSCCSRSGGRQHRGPGGECVEDREPKGGDRWCQGLLGGRCRDSLASDPHTTTVHSAPKHGAGQYGPLRRGISHGPTVRSGTGPVQTAAIPRRCRRWRCIASQIPSALRCTAPCR